MIMIVNMSEVRQLVRAQYRFGEIPCDEIEPQNRRHFDEMFRMEPMERIEAYMALTPEVRQQYWSHWMDVRHTLR